MSKHIESTAHAELLDELKRVRAEAIEHTRWRRSSPGSAAG